MEVILTDQQKENWNEKTKIACIYKVTNLTNGKIYIGQTVDFRKRVSEYKNADKKTGIQANRAIMKAIKDEGKDNFNIEIIEECDMLDLNIKEKNYITEYDSTNPEYGYNGNAGVAMQYSVEGNKKKSISHTGLKESASTKKKKSNTIIAINDEHIIVSDSGKLFGDYIGKSKDYIKNCLRQPSAVCGYRLFYDDIEKRTAILEKMYTKRCIRDKRYVEIAKMLNAYEYESVETMYDALYEEFGSIYLLAYKDPKNKEESQLELLYGPEGDDDYYCE